MKGAEEDYLELEKELDKQIRQMESTIRAMMNTVISWMRSGMTRISLFPI